MATSSDKVAAPPGLFPASFAQGFSLLLNQMQMGAHLMVNQQAQAVQMFSKSAQQAQVNLLGTLNQLVAGPAAQMARPPLVPIQALGRGGEGFAPSGFFPEWQPEAVKQKTQREVPYYPLTEDQRDFSKGGFTAAPQAEIPHPAPEKKKRAKTEFF